MNLTLHRPKSSDRIGPVILGSAAETVVRAAEIPVTIIP